MPAKKEKKVLRYTAIFEPAEEGGYVVTIPALPGCVTEGASFEEAVKMAKDAIKCYCASLLKHGEPIPQEPENEFIGTLEVPILMPA
ncbi:MAG: type II toxin-antitoxin system HicB family antitoxin [Candidatus Margulisiibacteriota bacterium]|nr:type II toxin-antitoxin system HicB family antitoxin [Candidatus Margulisiibacteriota bacterium]